MQQREKYTLADMTEKNIYDFFICRCCKKIVHKSEKPQQGNYETILLDNHSDSTIVVECRECREIQNEVIQRSFCKKRLEGFHKYFSKLENKK